MVHRRDIAVKFVLQGVGASAACESRAAGMSRDRGLHLPAVNIVEDDGGHAVATGLKTVFGGLVHGFIRVIHSDR